MPDLRAPGGTWTSELLGVATGQAANWTVRLLNVDTDAQVIAPSNADVSEVSTGNYTKTFTLPTTAGVYRAEWINGATRVFDKNHVEVTYTAGATSTPTGSDLCTVADVRAARGTSGSDTTQDSLVQSFITDASALIMSDYGQEFAPVTASATRKFLLHGGEDFVTLWPYSLQSASAVVVDTDTATTTTLTTDQYRLRPTPARDGVYEILDLQQWNGISPAANAPDREVSITGTWGYPSVPLEVKRACITTVVHWLNVNTATFPHADDSPDSMAPPKRGIPNEAREMLARFKRVWVG